MATIDRVEIKGFWSTHEVNIPINEDINFLIGANGSGKTTILNLISACLTGDSQTLSRIEFTNVKITLKDSKTKRKPSIEVIKDTETPFFQVTYKISESSSEKPYIYKLNELDEMARFRDSYQLRHRLASHGVEIKTVKQHLKEILNISWLSVNRSSDTSEPGVKSHDTSIDKKLDEFSNRLVRYLSALGKKANSLMENFQEEVFLSLLIQPNKDKDIFKIPSADVIKHEREALSHIFSQFRLNKKSYAKKIDDHFDILDRAGEKTKNGSGDLSFVEIASIFSLDRIEQTIEHWEKIDAERQKIFEPRESFLGKINSMMQRKTFTINEQNELVVQTQSGKKLPLHLLSSGEKQLLIILGEALLQERTPYIYIADEPELSLHVSWQEALTRDITEINPAAQILFATHSPDIVGSYQRKVIHVEKHIK